VEGVASKLAVYDFMAMVKDLQTLGCPNSEIKKCAKRYTWLGGALRWAGGLCGTELVPARAKRHQIVQIVGPWSFEYAGYQRLLSSFGGESYKFYRANKVLAIRIRFLDDSFGELELAL